MQRSIPAAEGVLHLNVERVGRRIPSRGMCGAVAGIDIGTETVRLTERRFVQRLKCLAGIVDSAVGKPANLKKVIHHTEIIRFAVEIVGGNVGVVWGAVIRPSVGECEGMAEFVHDGTSLSLYIPHLIVAVVVTVGRNQRRIGLASRVIIGAPQTKGHHRVSPSGDVTVPRGTGGAKIADTELRLV